MKDIAVADSYTTRKNTVLRVISNGVLMNDYDPDGDNLRAMLVTNPVHGYVILNNDGSLTYTPVNAYIGTDFFIYRVNDGLLDSNNATITLTVQPKR